MYETILNFMLMVTILYIFPLLIMDMYMNLTHYHKNGKYYLIKPELTDWLFVYCPLVNIIISFVAWIGYYPLKTK